MSRATTASRMSMWAAALVFAAGLTTSTGCPPDTAELLGLPSAQELIPPPEAMDQHVVLGGTAERAFIARTSYPEMAEVLENFNPLRPWEFWERMEEFDESAVAAYQPPDTDIVAVNLRTLESELVLESVQADAYAVQTDGRWLAWIDYAWDEPDQGSIHVIDLDAGTESTCFPGLAGGRIQYIAAVSDGFLIVEVGSPPFGAFSLVAMNLETQERLTIEQAFLVSGQAGFNGQGGPALVWNDSLLMHVWPPYEEGIDLESETVLSSAIDIVDLNTGERSTFAANAGPPAAGGGPDGDGGLYLTDNRVLLRWSDWEGRTTIRGFPLDGGPPEMLMELETPESTTGWRHVDALNDRGIVFCTTESDWTSLFDFKNHQWLEFRAFDGGAVPIAEAVIEGIDPASLGLTGWLVENYVIYRHPREYDYVVFDVETQNERRFDPFGG